MNLKKQITEINILITILGFYIVLVLPFIIISKNEVTKLSMLAENKLTTQDIISITPNILDTSLFLDGNKINLKPDFDFKDVNLVDKLHSNNTFYSIYSAGDLLGRGYINNEGLLVINDEHKKIIFKSNDKVINIKDGTLNTSLNESIKVSILRNGDIVFEDNLNLIRKKLNFEEKFVRFYIQTAIINKNILFLNKFIRDNEVYNKVLGYDFDFNNYEIKTLENITKSPRSNNRVYYTLLSPFDKSKKDTELYIYLNDNDNFSKYNSFHLLLEDIKIFKIDNDATKIFEDKLLNITNNLFKAGILFDIEVILNKNSIEVSNMGQFLKKILNIYDVKVEGISKSYLHETNNEVFKIHILDLNSYEKLNLVFFVKKEIKTFDNKKQVVRSISDLLIEEAK